MFSGSNFDIGIAFLGINFELAWFWYMFRCCIRSVFKRLTGNDGTEPLFLSSFSLLFFAFFSSVATFSNRTAFYFKTLILPKLFSNDLFILFDYVF